MRLAELEARIASISDLDEVVGAMRALAAVRLRQAQESLAAARVHAETIRAALDAARALVPPPELAAETPHTIVVFGTEHGFAGAYNERLLDEAAGCALIVVGSRAVALARDRGLDVIAGLAAASHPSGVLDVAGAATAELVRHLERAGNTTADVLHGRGSGAGTPTFERRALLPAPPPKRPRGAFPPLHDLEPRLLVAALGHEALIADLACIAMESLAAESAARMQAMSAARDNIERKLTDLQRAEHRARQDQVTTELLDLVTGTRALR